jgi:hypothetical protein
MAKDWITVAPSLDPVLGPVNAVIASIDSVLSFLIALLNVVQFILNIVKAFLIGLLNPIRAIIEAIIKEIRQIISDLRQAGLYIADDLQFFEVEPVNKTQDLKGGYSEYERRMLTRLLNRTDPTRPDLSSSATVVALFAYISSGDVFALMELLQRIAQFFGKRENLPSAPFPAPTTPTTTLGTFGLPVVRFKQPSKLTVAPDAINVSWAMPSVGTPFSKPPKGFLVHVSTVPDGFGVRAFKPNRENSQNVENLPISALAAVDPTDGTELRLYGGLSDISFEDSPAIFTDSTAEPRTAKLYFSLDQNTPLIPPDELNNGSRTPHGAATFYFNQPLSGLVGGGASYSCTLQKSDLPQRIFVESSGGVATVKTEDADTFYIRVRPVTDTYASNGGLTGTPRNPSLITADNPWKPYVITADTVWAATGIILNPFTGSETTGLYGKASQSALTTFPSASQLEFITAARTALAVLFLVRPDLVVETLVFGEDDDDDGGFQPSNGTHAFGYATGLEGLRDYLTRADIKPSFYEESSDPTTFSRQVLGKVDDLADRLFGEYTPSESIASAFSEQVVALMGFRWTDIDPDWPDLTILETLQQSNNAYGIAGRPEGYGLSTDESAKRLRKGAFLSGDKWVDRSPIFPERFIAGASIEDVLARKYATPGVFIEGMGWSDYCPVLFSVPEGRNGSTYILYIQFIRKLLIEHDGGAILSASASMLNVVSAAFPLTSGQWLAIRFLDKALQPLDALLTDLDAFLQAILDGLQGTLDKIIAYIEAIQARIYQLQALIEKIQALLNALALFDLPSFSGLLLVENGTDGIATGLVTAGNKPTDGPSTYAAGTVVLFGGLPAVILEIIVLLLAGGED